MLIISFRIFVICAVLNNHMNEKDIEKEAYLEQFKNPNELIKDAIREANALPKTPAGEKDNLDIIKHLIKRLAIHQVSLEKEAGKTNKWLLWLTLVSTIAALISLVNIFKGYCN